MARNENSKGFSLKDALFNKDKVIQLGKRFEKVTGTFNAVAFCDEVMGTMLQLELKQRIGCITDALQKQLPTDFDKACSMIVSALPEPLDPTNTDDDFGDFIYAPLGEYVVRHGLTQVHLKTSLSTLSAITKRFSMEDAIRSFLNAFPEETLTEMQKWTIDDNYHVRRLVSEGTRPLLPWSSRISIDQTQTLPLLNILHADSTRYVSRSVANHMNDISKTDPKLVVKTLKRWKRKGKQATSELDWMTRHSLRTLLKQGDVDALSLLGYERKPKITMEQFSLSPDSKKIVPGDTLTFSFNITSQGDEKLMIDYIIDFVKANGRTKSKVFKLTKKNIKNGETITITKKHRLLADATTFKLYPGVHTVSMQINGEKMSIATFILS